MAHRKTSRLRKTNAVTLSLFSPFCPTTIGYRLMCTSQTKYFTVMIAIISKILKCNLEANNWITIEYNLYLGYSCVAECTKAFQIGFEGMRGSYCWTWTNWAPNNQRSTKRWSSWLEKRVPTFAKLILTSIAHTAIMKCSDSDTRSSKWTHKYCI